jgi:hypothetical protein
MIDELTNRFIGWLNVKRPKYPVILNINLFCIEMQTCLVSQGIIYFTVSKRSINALNTCQLIKELKSG